MHAGATLADVAKVFRSLPYEYAYTVHPSWIEGRIPPQLHGTFFRNGPALMVRDPAHPRHVFDGDGMVASFAFKDGRCFFRNRYVRTQGFLAEQEAGRPLFRGAFTRGAGGSGRWFNPLDLRVKNVANTGVVQWGDLGLLAFWEQGRPYRLDPATLATLGESDLNGQLSCPSLAAHYRVITQPDGSRRWVAFSLEVGAASLPARLTFHEFDASGRLAARVSAPLAGTLVTLVHDLAVTEHWYVVVLGPLDLDLPRLLGSYPLGRASVAETLRFNPQRPTRVLLVPRGAGGAAGGQRAASEFTAPPLFTFHHANAYEVDGGRSVVVDTVAWDTVDFGLFNYDVNLPGFTPDYYRGGARTSLRRLVLDTTRPGSEAVCHRLARRTLEFPSVNWGWHGRPHRHIYCSADAVDDDQYWAPPQAICKVTLDPLAGTTPGSRIDWQQDVTLQAWAPGPRCYCCEALFVPRTTGPGGGGEEEGEDDGWLLGTFYDCAQEKGGLLVFDARHIEGGPLARITLPHHLPSGLHGSWSPEYWGPAEGDAWPAWSEPRKVREV